MPVLPEAEPDVAQAGAPEEKPASKPVDRLFDAVAALPPGEWEAIKADTARLDAFMEAVNAPLPEGFADDEDDEEGEEEAPEPGESEPENYGPPPPVRVDYETAEVVAFEDADGLKGVFDKVTGEIIDIPDAPRKLNGEPLNTADVEWYADQLDRSEGVIAGHDAARAAEIAHWTHVINAKYDAKIARERKKIGWIDRNYWYGLKRYAQYALAGAKVKYLVIGSRKLFFRMTAAGIDVLEPATAVQYAEIVCPEAVKVEKSVWVSVIEKAIPKTYAFGPGSGLKRRERIDEFKIEKAPVAPPPKADKKKK